MSNPEPTIRVNVDPANPGQFFACCGLLELGFRLYGDCQGRFRQGEFQLEGSGLPESINVVISDLLEAPELSTAIAKKSATGGSKSKLIPIEITLGKIERLCLDWWRDEARPPGKLQVNETCASSPFKTWTANQSPQQIIYDRLLPALRKAIKVSEGDVFHIRTALSGRFGFDPVAASVPIDVGWSPDKQEILVATSPAVELLAAIGLQRFRPRPHKTQYRTYQYSTWNDFFPPNIAAAACTGVMSGVIDSIYQFSLGERGDYKYFEYATLVGDAQ